MKEYVNDRMKAGGKNNRLYGVLAVTITSVCYGLVPSFSFIAFGLGVETETLLFNKFLYAAVIMWVYLLVKRVRIRFSRKAALTMIITCFGYIFMSTTLYISFDYISGSLATIVSFTFPAMIVAIEMITGREPVQLAKIAAVFLSFGGLVLIVWSPDLFAGTGSNLVPGEVGLGSLTASITAPESAGSGIATGGTLMGVFFAFLAAVGYVIYLFGLGAEAVKKEDSFAVAGYVMSSAAAVNFVRCLLSGKPLFAAEPAQIGMMLALSVICVFLAILFYAIGVRLIGPGNAALVNTMEPVLACIFGYFLVGDLLTGRMLIGAALVVAAVFITNLPRRKGKDGKTE